MKTLYLGVGDLYLPAAAAALHLEILDRGKDPQFSELQNIPNFRPVHKEDDGKLYFMGTDRKGKEVYIACVKAQPDVIIQGVESLLGIYQISQQELRVIPCIPENPQIALLNRLLTAVRLQDTAMRLAGRVVRNRFSDLEAVVLH